VSSSRQSKYVVRKEYAEPIEAPDLSLKSWARWLWRQLTSMRIALFLLLLLAIASVPGSVFPQRSADPNGVVLYFKNNPDVAIWLDNFQLFDVYSSTWFSAIYILLFISLIGCVIPRVGVHYKALRSDPPAAPTNLSRLPSYKKLELTEANIQNAAALLKERKFKVVATKTELRAEKGYLREAGNLFFHLSLIGVLISVGFNGGLSYVGQRVIVEGDTFVNNEAAFDYFAPGLLFDKNNIEPFSLRLDSFSTTYDYKNPANYGRPMDFIAKVSTKESPTSQETKSQIRVNEPLAVGGSQVYITGNGYAPEIVVRDKDGVVSFSGPVVFLPQDSNMTSLGAIKVPDANPKQFGMLAFFYPTVAKLSTGALTSNHPYPWDPIMTMNVYVGDLGLDSGMAVNAYKLDTHGMKQVAGGKSGTKALRLTYGETVELPEGLGTVEFKDLKRFASIDITHNPLDIWVLIFALTTLFGLVLMLIIPRRRVWVKISKTGAEVGALTKSKDKALDKLVKDVAKSLKKKSK
jgi:cytochrome c biogenesis protein